MGLLADRLKPIQEKRQEEADKTDLVEKFIAALPEYPKTDLKPVLESVSEIPRTDLTPVLERISAIKPTDVAKIEQALAILIKKSPDIDGVVAQIEKRDAKFTELNGKYGDLLEKHTEMGGKLVELNKKVAELGKQVAKKREFRFDIEREDFSDLAKTIHGIEV